MKWYFVAFAILSMMAYSCKNKEKNHFVTDINSLESKLDSLDQIVQDTAQETDFAVVKNVEKTLQKVKKHYTPDTVSQSFAEKINAYKQIKEALSSNSGNLAKAKQSIPEIQSKLSDLKHDIENGVNKRDKYQEFIDYETKKVRQVEELLNYYINTNNQFYSRYDSLNPIIHQFADSLKTVSHE